MWNEVLKPWTTDIWLGCTSSWKMGREKEYWLEKEKQRERNREKERKGKCPPSLFPSILSFKFVQRTKLKDWNIQLGETHTSIFGRQFKENLLSFQFLRLYTVGGKTRKSHFQEYANLKSCNGIFCKCQNGERLDQNEDHHQQARKMNNKGARALHSSIK